MKDMDPFVDCGKLLELLSASLDAELDSIEEVAVVAHLDICESCRATADQFSAVTRRVRLREASLARDLASAMMARARPARLGRGGWMRPALAWVAIVMGFQGVGPCRGTSVCGLAAASRLWFMAFRSCIDGHLDRCRSGGHVDSAFHRTGRVSAPDRDDRSDDLVDDRWITQVGTPHPDPEIPASPSGAAAADLSTGPIEAI